MEFVKERKQIVVQLSFKDENKQPDQPSKVTYRIDDIASGTEIKGNTDAIPSSPTLDITVTANENRILNKTKELEYRLFSFTWYDGATEIGNDAFIYPIQNLTKIPLPA